MRTAIVRLVWELALSALLVLPADGRVYRVDSQGHGELPTIRDAVTAAASGDTILLASGTYSGPKNRDINFGAKILTLRSRSGEPDSCIIDCESSGRGFLFDTPDSWHSLIEGITVTNGHADTGGAVLCSDHSSPIFSSCIFRQNRSDEDGGAIRCSDITGLVRFVDCIFVGNSAGKAGGAIKLCCCSEASFENCTIVGNVAQGGSAFDCVGFSYLKMTRSIVAFHTGSTSIQCGDGTCQPEFSFCDIYGNVGGDWVGCLMTQANKAGNISVDPAFRDLGGSDFRLLDNSTLPRSTASGPGIGALDD